MLSQLLAFYYSSPLPWNSLLLHLLMTDFLPSFTAQPQAACKLSASFPNRKRSLPLNFPRTLSVPLLERGADSKSNSNSLGTFVISSAGLYVC